MSTCAILLAVCSLVHVPSSALQDATALELPSEDLFRSVVRDLRVATGAGDLSPFRGEKLQEYVHAVTRPLGRLLPRPGESPTHPRLGGNVRNSGSSDVGTFPIVQLLDAPSETLDALDTAFAELEGWLRAEAGDWPVESWQSTDGVRAGRTARAQAFPFDESPQLELELMHFERGEGSDRSVVSSIFLRARAAEPFYGMELYLFGEREEREEGGGVRAMLDLAHELGLGPNARVSRVGNTPVSDQQGNDVAHAISGLARGEPTLVVFVAENGRLVYAYHPHAPLPRDEVLAADVPGRPGFPGETRFRRVLRSLMDASFTEYAALHGPRIYSYVHRPVETLGTRLPREGKDPAEEELASEGTVFSDKRSRMSQGDYPILDRRGVDRATHRGLVEGFEELRRWYLEETIAWEVEETFKESHDGEHLTGRTRQLTAHPTPEAHYDYVTLSMFETFAVGEDGVEAVDVMIHVLSVASVPLTGLTRARLEAYAAGGEAYKTGELLVEWMDARGFPPETEIIWIGERDVTWAQRGKRDQLLMDLQQGGTTPLLLHHLGRVERHDYVADPARLPDLPELHARLFDGRLSPDAYQVYLRTAEWTELEAFARRLADERERGFAALLGDTVTPDGRVDLIDGPLGSSAGRDHQWARPLGEGVAFELVLGRSNRLEDPERLHLTLVQKVRDALAALPELGADVAVLTDTYGAGSFALERLTSEIAGHQVVVSIRLPAPDTARALRTRLAAGFEPLDGGDEPVTSGWGKLRHRDSGLEVEGILRDGAPDGPGRLTDPRSGRVLVAAHISGINPGGSAVLFDPASELHVRGRVADGRLVERTDLSAWKGARDDQAFHGFDRLELGPYVLARGTVPGASPAPDASGQFTLSLPGIGTYTGSFVDGIAEGQGLLRHEDGVAQKLECRGGVPALIRTLAWPDGERLAYRARKDSKPLPVGDCLKGDTTAGEVVVLFGRERSGAESIYRGAYEDGKRHGQGSLESPSFNFRGNFERGERHGIFDIEVKLADGSVISTFQMKYVHGEHDLTWPPVQPNPEPRAVAGTGSSDSWRSQPNNIGRPMVYTCIACDGTGQIHDNGMWSYDTSFSPFLPGDRHYGSWNWTGYHVENPYSTTPAPRRGNTCRACNGAGVTR